jgi:phage shock protein A
MSSCLYPMTHSNGANPIGNQVRNLQQTVADLRRQVDSQANDITILKTQVAAALAAASAASVTATATKTVVDALPKTAPANTVTTA